MPRLSVAGWLLSLLALLVGVLGMSAAWVTAAVLADRNLSWLALVAALDMAMMLHLTRVPPGWVRIALAIASTAVAIVLSQWLIVATQLGFTMGLRPLDSAMRLGPTLAWQLSRLSLGRIDYVLLLASLPLAAILAQLGRRE